MCGFQPINMAAGVSRTEDEGCAVHVVTVRTSLCSAQTDFHTAQERKSDKNIWECLGLCVRACVLPVESPVIQKIRQDCSSQFVQFERCLRENQESPTSCSSHVARFVACAETVDISEVCKSLSGLDTQLKVQVLTETLRWCIFCVCVCVLTETQ